MSDENKSNESAQASDSENKADLTHGMTRFAQYTSPVMLVMLASAGKDMAFAQCSPCT